LQVLNAYNLFSSISNFTVIREEKEFGIMIYFSENRAAATDALIDIL
jgi:hypothetical protein